MFLSCKIPAVFLGVVLIAQAVLAQQPRVDELYQLAAGHYERQEYRQAIEKFRIVIERDQQGPHAKTSYFYLGESLVQIEDYQAAYPALKLFAENHVDASLLKRCQFRLAECAFRLGWENQAVDRLETFIATYPNDVLNEYALTYLGEIRLDRDEPQLAFRVFDRALKEFPSSNQAQRNRFGLAKSLQSLQRFAEATRFYQLIANDPVNPLAALAQLQLGIVEYEQSEFAAAKKWFRAAISSMHEDKSLVEAIYWLAKTEIALGHHKVAYNRFSEIVEQATDPDLKMAILFEGALAASKIDKDDVAIVWLNRLRKTWPQSKWADDALQLKIEWLFQLKRFNQALIAIEQFESDFGNSPNLAAALEYRGRILREKDSHLAAIEQFDFLLNQYSETEIATKRKDVWVYLKGLSQIQAGEFEAAKKSLASIDGADQSADFRAAVTLAQAKAAIGSKSPEQAIPLYQQYLAKATTEETKTTATFELLVALAAAKKWPDVRDTFAELDSASTTQDSPQMLETTLLVGELALKHSQLDIAHLAFTKLVNSNHGQNLVARGLSGLAWTVRKQGRPKASLEISQRLIKEHPDSSYAAEAAMVCGRDYENNKQYSAAIEMYRWLQIRFRGAEQRPLASIRLANCLLKTDQPENLKEAEKLLVAHLENQTKYLDQALYQLAWLHQDAGRFADAQSYFQQLLNQIDSPFWADAAYRIAKYEIDNEQYDRAAPVIALLQSAQTNQQIRVWTHFLAAKLAIADEDWTLTADQMAVVLSSTSNEELKQKARYWLAESLYQNRRYVEAESQFARFKEAPNLIAPTRQAWAALRQIQSLIQLEQWHQVHSLALEAKEDYADFPAVYELDYAIGLAISKSGRLSDAREFFQRVIDSKQGSNSETAAMAQWQIGETYFHQENYEQAIEAFNRVDSLYAYEKWRAAALLEAGKCQEQLGNWEHAVRLYSQLTSTFPDSPYAKNATGRLSAANREAKRIQKTHKQ